MSLLLTARPRASGDTFLMARQHILWPVLATGSGGTWVWGGDASSSWGGCMFNSSAAQGDYLEWTNVVLSPGDYRIVILGTGFTNRGIAHVSFAGADTTARVDRYASGLTYNMLSSDTFTVASKTRGTLRIAVDSKHAISGGYYLHCNQVAIVKTSAGTDGGTSVDDLPWIVDVPPMSYEAGSSSSTLTISGADQFGSYLYTSSDAHYLDYSAYLAAGTWTLHVVYYRNTTRGIQEVLIDGASGGTMDHAGALATNQIGTIAGISVPITGTHTVRTQCNGSSGGSHLLVYQWLQFRRTA